MTAFGLFFLALTFSAIWLPPVFWVCFIAYWAFKSLGRKA